MRRLCLFGCAAMLVAACTADVRTEDNQGAVEEVSFEIKASSSVRSSVSPDEYLIDDLTLVAYCDGELYHTAAFNGPDHVSMSFQTGRSYDLYALANVGRILPSDSEDDFLSGFCVRISDVSDLGESVPMASECVVLNVVPGMESVTVRMERLAAKIRFAVDDEALEGMKVESVRLCQSAVSVFPYNDFGGDGSKALTAADVCDGDYASVSDIEELNNGGVICLYAMENCRGVLLPGNTDSWNKVPDSLGEDAPLATYLEVGCTFAAGSHYVGNVTYRFYVGRDDCSDFNVLRNSDMLITLCVTEEALGRVSWKVEADVDVPGIFVDYVLDAKDYVCQYSCLEFPSAAPDSPVILQIRGKELIVTGERQKTVSFNVYDDEGSILGFFTCHSAAPDRVYFLAQHSREPIIIDMKQGARSASLTYAPKGVFLVLKSDDGGAANHVEVCESGTMPKSAGIYLADEEDGHIIDLDEFRVPDLYAACLDENTDFMIKDVSLYVEDKSSDEFGVSYRSSFTGECGLDEGEDYLGRIVFYGLDAGGDLPKEVELSMYEDNIFSVPQQDVELVINPAFPGQGYLGEFISYRFAPGSLASDEVIVPLDMSAGAGTSASLSVRRVALADVGDVPDEEMWLSGEDCEVWASMSSSMIRLVVDEPDPVRLTPLPCGALIVKASVRNPLSGRVMDGYYTFDLALYLSVGVQVDISGYDMAYSFVPFNGWSLCEYSDYWNEAIGGLFYVKALYEYGSGSYYRRVQVHVPESAEYNSLTYRLPVDFSDEGQDESFGEIVRTLLPLKSTVLDFMFYVSDTETADVLEITRTGAGAYPLYKDFSDGSKGYYHVVRQMDAADIEDVYGLDNHLIEVAYKSFDSY